MALYLTPLLLTLAFCFGIQSIALKAVGGRTTKSESNFFSSIARIQTGIRDSPDVMLLGSSMTGRFPDRTAGFTGIANLGCDGGSAMDTLRAMDEGILPSAPVLVIEGNTFYRSLDGATGETSKAIRGSWFSVGTKIPALGATARPSAFAYSKLLTNKIGHAESIQGPPLSAESPRIVSGEFRLSQHAESLIEETGSILDRMRSKGIKIMLVILPPGAPDNSLNILIPNSLSAKYKIPLIDLTKNLPPNAVSYTDGVHMTPTSAAAALRSILKALDDMEAHPLSEFQK